MQTTELRSKIIEKFGHGFGPAISSAIESVDSDARLGPGYRTMERNASVEFKNGFSIGFVLHGHVFHVDVTDNNSERTSDFFDEGYSVSYNGCKCNIERLCHYIRKVAGMEVSL